MKQIKHTQIRLFQEKSGLCHRLGTLGLLMVDHAMVDSSQRRMSHVMRKPTMWFLNRSYAILASKSRGTVLSM